MLRVWVNYCELVLANYVIGSYYTINRCRALCSVMCTDPTTTLSQVSSKIQREIQDPSSRFECGFARHSRLLARTTSGCTGCECVCVCVHGMPHQLV